MYPKQPKKSKSLRRLSLLLISHLLLNPLEREVSFLYYETIINQVTRDVGLAKLDLSATIDTGNRYNFFLIEAFFPLWLLGHWLLFSSCLTGCGFLLFFISATGSTTHPVAHAKNPKSYPQFPCFIHPTSIPPLASIMGSNSTIIPNLTISYHLHCH